MSLYEIAYDELASIYDEDPYRWRKGPDIVLWRFLRSNECIQTRLFVLDLCCGTGIQLLRNEEYWKDRSDINFVGLDLSFPMLIRAKNRLSLTRLVQGDGLDLPFADNSLGYISFQLAFHMFHDKERLLEELKRVLRPEGLLSILTADPWKTPNLWIYEYFPAIQKADEERFWPIRLLQTRLTSLGFVVNKQITQSNSHLTIIEAYGFASQRHHSSQFYTITEEDYHAGLSKLRSDCNKNPHKVLRVECCEVLLTARKLR